MAFVSIHRPLFTESKNVDFPNDGSLSTNQNGAFCKVTVTALGEVEFGSLIRVISRRIT